MSDQVPVTDPFDRRQVGNTSVQWVRDAFKSQTDKIDNLAEKVETLHGAFVKALPDGNVDAHHESHVTLERREVERIQREKDRAEKEILDKKFWRGVKEETMKYALKAIALFIIGLLVVGSQAKFKEWVVAATTTAEVKK
jgi:hypothetical protein